MKHTLRITSILIAMFFVTQLIGLFVINSYQPELMQVVGADGNITNQTTYGLPYGMDPPPEVEQQSVSSVALSFAIVFAIAVGLMLFLMKFNADVLIRLWFFFVVTLALGISINAILPQFSYASIVALVIALPLSFLKIFKRELLVHNLTELLIYPGIASIFVALIFSWTASPVLAVSVLLVGISLYDMYAVWHAGFMQKMAKYQINNLKIFTGFFLPYTGKNKTAVKTKKKPKKGESQKVSVAILGGGDVVFPIILAGVIFNLFGFLPAIVVSICATIALAGLFWLSEKGKFYPAMPFISAGCFAGLGLVYLLF